MKKVFLLSIMTILLSLTSLAIAVELIENIPLNEGKNNLNTSLDFKPVYVSDFIKKYPEIQSVTYNENNKTGGYINYLQGIGEDFILRPNKQYEIFSSENISIQI